jgi:signal transduction histidine kinase/CheY-like chemotaxis protein
MRITLRHKLAAIVGSTAIAFLAVIITSALVARRVEQQMATVERRLIPKLELGPQLKADFEALGRSYQEAVAAHDGDALDRTRGVRDRMVEKLAGAHEVLDPATSAEFRVALGEYHDAAFGVSRRMIAGDTGEEVVDGMAAMQRWQTRARELLSKLISFDDQDLAHAFQATRAAQDAAARTSLLVTGGSLVLALALSLWLTRGMVRSFGALEAGFFRFGKGDFAEPIAVQGADEIADVAGGANRMAESLARLARERNRADWIKSGQMELDEELRGELAEEEVATRAVRHLARYLEAPAGAIYGLDSGRVLRLLGHMAMSVGTSDGGVVPSFALGEGLVGAAAKGHNLVVVHDPPRDFLRVRSALGESAPTALILVPLVCSGNVIGVLELAFFRTELEGARELLLSVQESVGVALEVARSRAAAQALLTRTIEQATQLARQEGELRAANEELQCQQEELRLTNEELAQQTEKLEAQRSSLVEKNNALSQARHSLEEKASELSKASAYKSQFLANMSHELRTPLNSMLLLSNLLADNTEGGLSSRQVEYAKTIHSAGQDLLALINHVLDLAKVESGKHVIRVEPVLLLDVADRVRRVFGPLAKEKGLGLSVTLGEGLPQSILTDGQRLAQILNNLVGNAIKFTDSGSVKLEIQCPDPGLRFSRGDLQHARAVAFAVTDTGVGIAVEHQERVFAPFEQVDGGSNRRHGGTGLGLSIAREFAALLGGELQLDSRAGAGSTFALYLPYAAAAASPEVASPMAPPREPAPVVVAGQDRRGLGHLLVIEDDPVFSHVMADVIREQGLAYLIATDGKSGLQLARERRPSGIILDVKLPDTDGWEVMEALRADPVTATIPVHVVSALAMRERALAMGACGYLRKPTSKDELVRVVESLASKRQGAASRILLVEDATTRAESLIQQLTADDLDVRCVGSAGEALGLLGRESFACMVLDLALPDLGDLELLAQLQEGGAKEMPPVVIYANRALSKAEAQRLETYAEAVVLNHDLSAERLLQEVRLFVRRLQAGLHAGLAAPSAQPPFADVRLEKKKILVVDDDMRTVYALSAMLRSKGAEVLVGDTGAVALAALAEHPDVDVVLMDIMMPEMDGYEAMEAIREQSRFARLPIIALTANAMKGDEARCFEAGATAYLAKPVDMDALFEKLDACLTPGLEDA